MTVQELIDQLTLQPPSAPVIFLLDGEEPLTIDQVFYHDETFEDGPSVCLI